MLHQGHEPTGKERRRFPRLRAESLIRYRLLGESEGPDKLSFPSLLQNISGGGISFLAPAPLPFDRFVALDLVLPTLETPVMALGRVRRCARVAGQDRYLVAVEFWWTGWQDEQAQRTISDCIRNALDGGQTEVLAPPGPGSARP